MTISQGIEAAKAALKESLRDTLHHDGPLTEENLLEYHLDHAARAAVAAYLEAIKAGADIKQIAACFSRPMICWTTRAPPSTRQYVRKAK